MRSSNRWSLVLVIGMIILLLPAAQAGAGREAVYLDGQARSLELSKFVVDQLNYQGYLIDATDSSAVTAALEMTFRLFDSETKGAELWSEAHPMVDVSNGLFQVLLGSQDAFPTGLFEGSTLWLQTEIGTEMLTPRKPLVSVAYSQKATKADHAATADFAADAQHSIYADTADHVAEVGVWTVNGDDIYRGTGKVGIGTATPSTELDVAGSVKAATYYGDGSNLTGVSGTADADWTISGSDMYSGVSGNVGIGTSSPAYPLHVDGIASAKGLWLPGAFGPDTSYVGQEGNFVAFGHPGSSEDFIGFKDNTFYFMDSPSGADTTDADVVIGGRLGIGMTEPWAGLHVRGNGYPRSFIFLESDSAADAGIRLCSGNTVKWHIFNSSTDDDGLRIYNSTGAHTVFFADQEDGDVGIGTVTPVCKLDVYQPMGIAIKGTDSTTTNYGYVGCSTAGVFGSSNNQSGVFGGSTHYRGVHGYSEYDDAVYGWTDTGNAGYFSGPVHVTGALSKGSGTFLIDHPLDPENKLLSHSFVESPENLLIYRGKARLDAEGQAVVRMPDYFRALTEESEATIHLTWEGLF